MANIVLIKYNLTLVLTYKHGEHRSYEIQTLTYNMANIVLI